MNVTPSRTGKSSSEDPPQGCVHALVAVVERRHLGGVVVGSAPATEGDPSVTGALAVDRQVPVVGEGRALLEADLRPGVVGQRLRRRHERVDRRDGAAPARDGRRVALGREDDVLGSHRAVRRDDPSAAHVDGRRALVDDDAAPLDGVGQAADEPRRVDGRAVRGERAAEGVADAGDRRDLVGVEEPVVLLAEAPLAMVGDLLTDPLELRRVARDGEVAALVEVAVDALRGGDPADVGHRVVQQVLHPHRRVAAALGGHPLERGGEEGRAPAAVATRRRRSRRPPSR